MNLGWAGRIDDLETNPYYGNFISNCPFLNMLLYYPTNSIPYLEGAAMRASRSDDLLEHPYDRIIPAYMEGIPSFSFASSEGPLVLPDFYEEYPLMVNGESTLSGSEINNIMYKFSMVRPGMTEEQLNKLRTFEVLPQDAIHPLKSKISSIDVMVFVPWHLSGPDLEDILDGHTEENFASGSTVPVRLLTLTPPMFEYNNITREVTITQEAFDIIKSKIRALPWSLLFSYKINIETLRSIYDPNDDLSVAQAQKIALMQSSQMHLLDYFNEFSQGVARGEMDYQTGYTLAVTMIATAVTIAASIGISGVVSLAQGATQTIQTGLTVAGEAVEQSINVLAPQVANLFAYAGYVAGITALSVVEECFEEIIVDELVGRVIEDTVENLGGDESAKIFWSVLGESLREGLMGIMGDVAGINLMQDAYSIVISEIATRYYAFKQAHKLLRAQQALNEYRQRIPEQEAALDGLYANMPAAARSSYLFFMQQGLANLRFSNPALHSSIGKGLTFYRQLVKEGYFDDGVSLIDIIQNKETVGTSVELSSDISLEVYDSQRYALSKATKEQELLAAIEKQAPLTPELVNLFREVHPQGFMGIPGYDPILDLMDYAQFHSLPVEHMTFWGAQPAGTNERSHLIDLIQAVEDFERETGKHAIWGQHLTEGFRKWVSQHYKVPIAALPYHKFVSENLGEIQLFTNQYIFLYKSHIEDYLSKKLIEIQNAEDKGTQNLLEYSFDILTIERIFDDITNEMAQQIMKNKESWMVNDFSIAKLKDAAHYTNAGPNTISSSLLRKYELLFSIEENTLSSKQRSLLKNELDEYRNLRGVYEKDAHDTAANLLDELEMFQDLRDFYFKEKGVFLGWTLLCREIGISENYYTTHFVKLTNARPLEIFQIEMFIEKTFANKEFKQKLLKKIDDWRVKHHDTSIYAIQDTPMKKFIYRLLLLWRATHNDKIIAKTDLSNKIAYKVFLDSMISGPSHRPNTFNKFEVFLTDSDNFDQSLKEIQELLDELDYLRKYYKYQPKFLWKSHDHNWLKSPAFLFQMYYQTRFTLGMDILTCTFDIPIGESVRHHANQNPLMIFMFTGTASNPEVQIVPVIFGKHQKDKYLHGDDISAMTRNEILKSRMLHLIELSKIEFDVERVKAEFKLSRNPTSGEIIEYYTALFKERFLKKEFIITSPQQQIEEGSSNKLWNSFSGKLNVPGIESFETRNIDEFAQEFAKRWIDWKTDDVSEKEWFKRYDNEEFYERWLEFKDRLNARFYSEEWTTWFVQYYWEHETFPDGFIPEIAIFDEWQ